VLSNPIMQVDLAALAREREARRGSRHSTG